MPIFEYRCSDCGRITEHIHLAGDGEPPARVECRGCGHHERTKRIPSVCGVDIRESFSWTEGQQEHIQSETQRELAKLERSGFSGRVEESAAGIKRRRPPVRRPV